jgi:hypothetical protein
MPGKPATGGGLFLAAGAVDLTGSKISDNIVAGGSGAPRFTGSHTIGGTGGPAAGGGLFVHQGTVRIMTSAVSDNRAFGGTSFRGSTTGAAQGGGLFLVNGALHVSRTTISGNSAQGVSVSGLGGEVDCPSAAERSHSRTPHWLVITQAAVSAPRGSAVSGTLADPREAVFILAVVVCIRAVAVYL